MERLQAPNTTIHGRVNELFGDQPDLLEENADDSDALANRLHQIFKEIINFEHDNPGILAKIIFPDKFGKTDTEDPIIKEYIRLRRYEFELARALILISRKCGLGELTINEQLRIERRRSFK